MVKPWKDRLWVAFAYVCICVRFYSSLVCTDSKVSRKQLSLRDLVIKTNAASSRGTFSLNSQGHSVILTRG